MARDSFVFLVCIGLISGVPLFFYVQDQSQVISILAVFFMWLISALTIISIFIGSLTWTRQKSVFEKEKDALKMVMEHTDDKSALAAYESAESKVKADYDIKRDVLFFAFLGNLIKNSHSNTSVADRLDIISNLSESYNTAIELEFRLARYVVWLVPTIGFLGTVWGIRYSFDGLGQVLNAGESQSALDDFLSQFSIAFETTLAALFLSMVVFFVITWHERIREKLIIDITEYYRSDATLPLTDFSDVSRIETFSDLVREFGKIAPDLVDATQLLRETALGSAEVVENIRGIRADMSNHNTLVQNVIVNGFDGLSSTLGTSDRRHDTLARQIAEMMEILQEMLVRMKSNDSDLKDLSGAFDRLKSSMRAGLD